MTKGWSFDAFVAQFYELVYPVGICVDFINTTDPNKVFQGTTWERIKDGYSVRTATSDVVSKGKGYINGVGGSDSVSLSKNNIPAHSHNIEHSHNIRHSHTSSILSAGGHTHDAGNLYTDYSGDHVHHIGHYVMLYNLGDESKVINSDCYNNGSRNDRIIYNSLKNTGNGGSHKHEVTGSVESAGTHTHTSTVNSFDGSSGISSKSTSGETGSGTYFDVTNKSRYYARWCRTK